MKTIRLSALCVFLACASALAQTSQINGTVRDASGLAIPSAAIKATQTATGIVRSTSRARTAVMCFRIFPLVRICWR